MLRFSLILILFAATGCRPRGQDGVSGIKEGSGNQSRLAKIIFFDTSNGNEGKTTVYSSGESTQEFFRIAVNQFQSGKYSLADQSGKMQSVNVRGLLIFKAFPKVELEELDFILVRDRTQLNYAGRGVGMGDYASRITSVPDTETWLNAKMYIALLESEVRQDGRGPEHPKRAQLERNEKVKEVLKHPESLEIPPGERIVEFDDSRDLDFYTTLLD